METHMKDSASAAHALKVTTPSDREIRTERIVEAPRDHVWRAFTDPRLIAKWWGRGNELVIERMEVERGGHWRFTEHSADEGTHGFEGRFREVAPPGRIVQSFEWDGMPGHVSINTVTLEDLGEGRTRIVTNALFHTKEERDGMMGAGMDQGMSESYEALDRILASWPGFVDEIPDSGPLARGKLR